MTRPVRDAAVTEPAREAVARRRFLRSAAGAGAVSALGARSAGGAGAVSALGAFLGGCGSSNSSSTSTGTGTGTTSSAGAVTADLEIVNFALTLEHLQQQFYADVIGSGLLASSPALPTLRQFGAEEREHVEALRRVAGTLGTPAQPPVGRFPLSTAADVMSLAATIENLGAAAYLGLIGSIRSKAILATVLAIHSVEGRHAAVLNAALKLTPTPQGAFASPLSTQQVLAAVKPFIAG